MKELFLSVSNFQMECPKISKDANNPFFKGSKYATLPHILSIITPILKKNGLVIMQPVINNCVVTKLIHIDSGECIESVYEIKCKDDTNPQQLGSGVSYARRYSISSILNLNIDDDDDGNAATGNVATQSKAIAKEELTPNHPTWTKAKEHLQTGGLLEDIERKYIVSAENKKLLIALK
jgi:hypothetical protein